MWWIIGLLWVITVVIVVAMCIGAKDSESRQDGYSRTMTMYFIYGFSLREIHGQLITEVEITDNVEGCYDAIDTLESFGFPDTYNGEYLP